MFRGANPLPFSANAMQLHGSCYVQPYANENLWVTAPISWASNATQVRDAVISAVEQAAANNNDTVVASDVKVFFGIPTSVVA
jgi:hypothetical protein